ncbi:GtrA family protein [Pseudomonas gingeri]|uniref:GtrA family protein n=1 Tax=Pseudomonas gingeri TaxID=117681 RepID=UPI0015A2E2F0|nr:GtrA family protein [Pseudomonas gingeri]NWA24131.1 GtrA family protein [Pseudomonas gingeri]NWD69516.1 GtrA family protein [Pseudomonas gingeri]
MKSRMRKWAVFLMGGLLNTAITYGIYLLLGLFLTYQVAYVIAYACGIGFSYLFNSQVVFQVKRTWIGFVLYPLVYLIQYVLSASILHFMVERLAISKEIAPLLIVVLLTPVTYLLSKTLLHATHQSKSTVQSQVSDDK